MVRLFMLISIPFALAGAPQAASQDAIQLQDAGKLFAQRCAECHGARAISAWGRKMPNEAQRRQWLEGFLQTHYPPPEAERALIIEHIQSQIEPR
jgi:cytochrome c553